MSVRIIFRGLILFRFPGGLADPKQIVAHLINKRDLPERSEKKDAQGPEEGHEHYHEGLIQVLTGDPTEDMAPEPLRRLEDIDITVNDGTGGIVIEESFLRHVPQLSQVIDKGKGKVKSPIKGDDTPTRPELIQNTITVDRGRVRVRNVVTWDQGAFPLTRETRPGAQAASHARINFVGSDESGFFASEFVVDIPDATGVTLRRKTDRARGEERTRLTATADEKEQKRRDKLNRSHDTKKRLNHRVRYDSVEILITNYEFQGGVAIPWGLDFQWLFEALGYSPVDLNDAGFAEFAAAARAYDADVYVGEVGMLLGRRPNAAGDAPDPFTIGLPFPYIASPAALVSVRQGTDEESRPICIGGFQGGGP